MGNYFFFILMSLLLAGCGQSDSKVFQGYVEGSNTYLASPNSGILVDLAVERGEIVKKGQLLFQLDPDPEALIVKQYEEKLEAAAHTLKDLQNPRRTPEIQAIKAQIDQVDAKLQLAKIRLDRYQKLYEKNAVDKDSVDEARINFVYQQNLKSQYQANLELAQLGSREEQIQAQKEKIAALLIQYHQTQWQLQQKRMTAPADGIVFDTYYNEGEFVGTQKPVLSLLTAENVQIEFFVPVEILPKIRLNQAVGLDCYGCKQKGQAFIVYISPEAQYLPPLVYSRENSDKLVFRVKARLPDFNHFKPGQPVTVYLP